MLLLNGHAILLLIISTIASCSSRRSEEQEAWPQKIHVNPVLYISPGPKLYCCPCSCRFDKYQMDTHQRERVKPGSHLVRINRDIRRTMRRGVLNSGINGALLHFLGLLCLLLANSFPCCAVIHTFYMIKPLLLPHTANYRFFVGVSVFPGRNYKVNKYWNWPINCSVRWILQHSRL